MHGRLYPLQSLLFQLVGVWVPAQLPLRWLPPHQAHHLVPFALQPATERRTDQAAATRYQYLHQPISLVKIKESFATKNASPRSAQEGARSIAASPRPYTAAFSPAVANGFEHAAIGVDANQTEIACPAADLHRLSPGR